MECCSWKGGLGRKKVNLNHFRNLPHLSNCGWCFYILKGFHFLPRYQRSPTSVSKKSQEKSSKTWVSIVLNRKRGGGGGFGGKTFNIHLLKWIPLGFSLAQPKHLINVQLCVQSWVEATAGLDYGHTYKPYSSHMSSFTLIVTLKIKRQPQHPSDN